MKWSKTFIPTLKESPKEAEIASHKLMLRSGMIQNLSSGLYIFLPLGKKVLDKIMGVIREVLEEYNCIELSMPALQPKEVWERTGRWDLMGDLMMKVKDREDREFVLGPTHEEIITDLVAKRINSYKQIPINFYQIQSKFRDEIRPRFGLIRAKEFIMKDGYSFDLTKENALKTYEQMYEAYFKIFNKLGLDVSAVEADTGAMGDGGRSHEFMALTSIGEDTIAKCLKCNYAANLEKAIRIPHNPNIEEEKNIQDLKLEKVYTENIKSVEDVAKFFQVETSKLIKTLIYEADKSHLAVLIRGDIEVNEIKLKSYLKVTNLNLASEKDTKNITNASVGFAGPVNLNNLRIVADLSVKDIKLGITGANETDYHYKNVVLGKDFLCEEFTDIGLAKEGDLCTKCTLPYEYKRGIEVGQVFYLGEKYTEKLGAKVLDSKGKEIPLVMGCYGIGVSRLVAAIIECHNDENGILWPISCAPFSVIITALDLKNEEIKNESLRIYEELKENGIDVLLDDRNERPGVKFKDAELIGIPVRITIGKKSILENSVEIFERKSKKTEKISCSDCVKHVLQIISNLR